MDYEYVRCSEDQVQYALTTHARDGWRVHTFNRNAGASVIDILFERDRTS